MVCAGCDKTSAGGAGTGAPQATPVQVIVAKSEKIPASTEYLAVLKSRNASNINPQVEGYVTRILVKSGDRVTAGTVLLQIDPPKQELDNAQTTYDAAVAQLKSLEEQVKQQRAELRYYSVVAPTGGVVGDIPVRVGDRVTVATLLTTVNEPGGLEAYIYVPADRARDLKMGMPVRLVDENGTNATETRVTFSSPQVDPDTQTLLVKAAVREADTKLRIA